MRMPSSRRRLEADVVVAVIGAQWTDIWRQRRLDGSADAVSAERVVAALRRGLPVIPVLVGGAGMPSRAELPETLAGAGRQASGDCRNRHVHRRFVPAHFEIERRAPKVHRESSPENKDALRQRRITELQDGIRAAAEAGEWQTVLNLASELSSLGPPNDDPEGLVTTARQRLAEARRRRLNSNPDLASRLRAAAIAGRKR